MLCYYINIFYINNDSYNIINISIINSYCIIDIIKTYIKILNKTW